MGRTIPLDGESCTVVGVPPPGFQPPIVREVDPDQAVSQLATMNEPISGTLAPGRYPTGLLGAFSPQGFDDLAWTLAARAGPPGSTRWRS